MNEHLPTEAHEIDEALDPLGHVIAGFGTVQHLDPTNTMRLDTLVLDLPVELEVYQQRDGGVRLGAAPPTQYHETTVMPVFHRLRVRVERVDDGGA